MKKKQILIEAQRKGEKVKVVYKSGSQPNHAREIIPLKIENGNVFAKCLNSNTNKLFRISKLKLLTDEQYTHFAKWDLNFISPTDYEIYEIKRNQLKKTIFPLSIILVILVSLFYIQVKTS